MKQEYTQDEDAVETLHPYSGGTVVVYDFYEWVFLSTDASGSYAFVKLSVNEAKRLRNMLDHAISRAEEDHD